MRLFGLPAGALVRGWTLARRPGKQFVAAGGAMIECTVTPTIAEFREIVAKLEKDVQDLQYEVGSARVRAVEAEMREKRATAHATEDHARIARLETGLRRFANEEPHPMDPSRLDHCIYLRYALMAQAALDAR